MRQNRCKPSPHEHSDFKQMKILNKLISTYKSSRMLYSRFVRLERPKVKCFSISGLHVQQLHLHGRIVTAEIFHKNRFRIVIRHPEMGDDCASRANQPQIQRKRRHFWKLKSWFFCALDWRMHAIFFSVCRPVFEFSSRNLPAWVDRRKHAAVNESSRYSSPTVSIRLVLTRSI